METERQEAGSQHVGSGVAGMTTYQDGAFHRFGELDCLLVEEGRQPLEGMR